jgi:hypothetical protein
MEKAPSLLMCVGRQHYSLAEFVEEAESHGLSKRIPVNSIPEGLVPGLSKIFVAHPDAIVKVRVSDRTLIGLACELVDLGTLSQEKFADLVDMEKPFWTGQELHADDFVPAGMLDITLALSKTSDEDRARLIHDYDLEFVMGVFGWSLFSGFQLVLPKGEGSLPQDLDHLDPLVDSGYVEMVHMEYDE